MKISNIEYDNFRNFRDHGEIKCSTDGKVTIVYGKNGDGKTTLHQLFQWVFYGQVHFNKTTTDHLYNLQYESEQAFGSQFQVMGCIDFEHNGYQYSVRRTYTYKKGLNDSEKIAEDFELNKMDDDNNWKRIERPKDVIEKLLPPGLADYFFFDGESMIADLRVKGKDSAGKLRKALYSMFDLDILESAIAHVGRTDLKTTALGKLYLSKGTIVSGSNIAAIKTNIESAQARLEKIGQDIKETEDDQKKKKDFLVEISEKIGGHKSKTEYERQRKECQKQQSVFLKNAEDAQSHFGDAVLNMFPQLLISKAVTDAKQKIHLKIEDNKLPYGITKKLINYLTLETTSECICGNKLCDEEKEHIKEYLSMLPPRSYTSLYNEFSTTARHWSKGYDKAIIENYIISVLNNNEQAEMCDKHIRELDEEEKKSPDIEDLIIARQQAEADISQNAIRLQDLSTEKKKFELYLNKQMKIFDQLTTETAEAEEVNRKISILEEVAKSFKEKLEKESLVYSKKLEKNIQELIDKMLTSRRTVSVSNEFSVRVTDSYNDESKSEGQFAVVSFAYIGGILKMLQSEENLSSKEYPLVLDGPFSKLDPDQRQNVVNIIPSFAPQVILFSKDDLSEVFKQENMGRVWTIVSNDEKNVASVKEGYLWS